MKITKSDLKDLVRECIEEQRQIDSLTETEIQDILKEAYQIIYLYENNDIIIEGANTDIYNAFKKGSGECKEAIKSARSNMNKKQFKEAKAHRIGVYFY